MSLRRAAFLDRDGVLNDPVVDPESGLPESPLRADDVRLAAGAADGARRLRDAGYALVIVTNQPAAAKDKVTVEGVRAVHARVESLLEAEGVTVERSFMCLHHPAGVVPHLTRACACRKPAAGMLVEAAAELGLDLPESWIFGDGNADIGAGRTAGCRVALVEHPGTAHRRREHAPADVMGATLDAAARLVLMYADR